MTVYGAAASSVIWWALWPAPIALGLWLWVTHGLGFVEARQSFRIRNLPGSRVPRQPFNRSLARNIGTVIAVYSIAEAVAALILHAVKLDPWIFPVAVYS